MILTTPAQERYTRLREPPHMPGHSDAQLQKLTHLKAELQLRTMAQHIWADIYHELGYKNEFYLPRRWEREFARLAALLENCDKDFQAIKDAMSTYESSYGAYITHEQLQNLANSLETLLLVDTENMKAVHRLIRVYLALADSNEQLSAILGKYHDTLPSYPPALRDMGVAYCQLYAPKSPEFIQGQKLLRQVIESDPRDIDARCSLAGTYRRQERLLESRDCYRHAHYLDPTNPYPLGNYIALELLLKGDMDTLHHFHASIKGAMERCHKQIEISVNLPWALFDMGIFHLYLGEPYASISYYAKGIASASKAWMIRSAHNTIQSFIDGSVPLEGLDILDLLLKLGWWIKATEAEKQKPFWSPTKGSMFLQSPVLILAGGCGGLDSSYQSQFDLLRDRLRSFRGTIISGGTKSGIAGIAGDLQEAIGPAHLQTVGYVPTEAADGLQALLDPRYRHHRYTAGTDFSPLEALTYWEDCLASGEDPHKMKLIGFNGGRIASCEYKIALAFGAQVGIVRGSGRAADELLTDLLWKDYQQDCEGKSARGHASLHWFDVTGDELKIFLGAS